MPPVRIHVVVSGEVQGIGYRAFIKRRAQSIGVIGWIRNLENGSVEAVFQGESDIIEEVIAICNRGPVFARVKNVQVFKEEPRDDLSNFSIIG
ncbi:MAG: acylphosphatase [Thaumarchaeota archaeon]|jgi:acylphosphatase|nr:acylphosphatase [Nitrososphaerota archaeon]|tara:strand:- start:3589 stop:3867 length:279 start_codon:yes stop_codon:yes gene_type:complete